MYPLMHTSCPDWKRPRRTGELGFNRWMGQPISASQYYSQPWTAHCGDRYDPQPVSEWVRSSCKLSQYCRILWRFWPRHS